MKYEALDFSNIHTYSAHDRHNLVRIDTLLTPGVDHAPTPDCPELSELAR